MNPMRRGLKLVVALVAGLAAAAVATTALVQSTTRSWFEKDVSLRAQLAVNGARRSLASHWQQKEALGEELTDLTRDERVMAAAACSSQGARLAATAGFPASVHCGELAPHVDAADAAGFGETLSLPGGLVHVSAISVSSANQELGFIVLIHDLSYVERRETTLHLFMVLMFGILAAAASALTLVATRASWKRWSEELRRQLQGGERRPEFQPILRDVRTLVERIISERDVEQEAGDWTPDRLKSTLARHVHNERIVALANREPYIHQKAEDGSIKVLHPASGLVTALEPVLRACSGVWVAHGAGSADRESVDEHDRVRVPPGEESFEIRRVWLTESEEHGYYYGFSNEGLWPLCHIAHARPIFRADDFAQYRAVNEKFAIVVCEEVHSEDPIILVQDYHFALAPRMIRDRLPRATVITFWHIPWPNSERFGICPWRSELIDGLLGSSILGFQTQAHCNNFLDSADRYLEARIDRDQHGVVRGGRRTIVRPYPISVEWPVHWLDRVPRVEECRRSLREELGLRPDALLGVGVDRLDYTKGIEERLLSVERLLERFPEYRGRFHFIQVAAPSRTVIERYRQLNESVEKLSARINERFGTDTYRPVILQRVHHEPQDVYRLYRAAELCYVSSLHDGMNLVAKEFVAAREDEQGVLLLSQFTGAARELPEALIVNPYDLEQASAAMATALGMSAEEQRARMRSMRAFVAEFNVYRWAGRMLVDAARLRRRERLRLLSESDEEELGRE
jgi:trehalose-6-phosphate synthase